jgi:hypothetical protein
MSYAELIQQYFERSTALQWYWTIYVLVIGGVLGFSTFRQRPELVTTILVTILYGCFAYKNLGAIEATAVERHAILTSIRDYPAAENPSLGRVRTQIEPALPDYDIAGARYFHLACDVLTVLFLWIKEWRRNQPQPSPLTGSK